MSIIATVKEHPALTVAGIVGVLVIVYVINHSGNASSGSTVSTGSSVDAATAYQQSLLAASAQANQVQAAVTASSNHDAASIELAKIASQQSGAHDAIAGQVATSQINAAQQVQSLLASLSADVSKTNSNNDVAKTAISVNGQTQMQQILANALVAQSTNQANVSIAGFQTQAQIAGTYAGAQQNIAYSHDEHSGGLFGGGGFLGLGI